MRSTITRQLGNRSARVGHAPGVGSGTFRDRVDAGRLLGATLRELDLTDPLILGLPRGGVVIAAEVARVLDVRFDVFVARKIGHPYHPELGLGAVAEGGDPTYDDKALRHHALTPDDLAPVVEAERAELARRVAAYRGARALPPLSSRTVVLVDDGIATGGTARAALQALRSRDPDRLVFAVPVGPKRAPAQLEDYADDIVILCTPTFFGAVGQWYDEFAQVSDDEVLALLAETRG